MSTSQPDRRALFEPVAREELAYLLKFGFTDRYAYGPVQPSAPNADATLDIAAFEKQLEGLPNEVGETRRAVLATGAPRLNGLALSGGGIRSAAFCMGVLEGLASAGLLSKFHYVSSVSGGGYIAAWLAAWCSRHSVGIAGVEQDLKAASRSDSAASPVRHLLRYVTYLAPQMSMLSLDLWTLIAAYARNLMVTLSITFPYLFAVAALPQLLVLALPLATQSEILQVSARAVCVCSIAFALSYFRLYAEGKPLNLNGPRHAHRPALLGLLFLLVGSTSYLITLASGGLLLPVFAFSQRLGMGSWGGPLMLVLLPSILLIWHTRGATLMVTLGRFVASTAALMSAYLMAGLLDWLISKRISTTHIGLFDSSAVLLGVMVMPAWLLIMVSGETVRQALLSRYLSDVDREWMARFVATMLKTTLGWVALCVVTFVLPQAFGLDHVLWGALGLGVSLLFIRLKWPTLAASGMLVIGAVATMTVVGALVTRLNILASRWAPSDALIPLCLLVMIVLGVGVALFVERFVDVNRFSLHALYRDRLVRTFLGASRAADPKMAALSKSASTSEAAQYASRDASPFHNFDENDNVRLASLRSDRQGMPASHWMPIFLFNAATNRTWGGAEPGRITKAFSFVFSAFRCGADEIDYCATSDYDTAANGLTLGTAMATSGAALSSKSGRYDSPLLAFFATLFNLRLGWWLAAPTSPLKTRASPSSTVSAHLAEMAGRKLSTRDWIHLSDGGHFENLGAFELLKRGCRRITIVDGSADPKRQFSDLANLIRLAREEFNITIVTRGGKPVFGNRDMGFAGRYCSLYQIQYPNGALGGLLYIKAAYYSPSNFDVPIEVHNYAMAEDAFPHQPTVDQFFTPAQFDSYRQLGLHEASTILASTSDEEYDGGMLLRAAAQHLRKPDQGPT